MKNQFGFLHKEVRIQELRRFCGYHHIWIWYSYSLHIHALLPDFFVFKTLVPPGLEPGTFRVLSERDNHYTTELVAKLSV